MAKVYLEVAEAGALLDAWGKVRELIRAPEYPLTAAIQGMDEAAGWFFEALDRAAQDEIAAHEAEDFEMDRLQAEAAEKEFFADEPTPAERLQEDGTELIALLRAYDRSHHRLPATIMDLVDRLEDALEAAHLVTV